MKIINMLAYLVVRLRYPVSLPEDIASDLGLDISNSMKFDQLICCLTDPHRRPSKLTRFMPRNEAEDAFRFAKRKERFAHNTLFSYHFKGGWIEFALQFDEKARLRRLYIRHKDLKHKHEIPISP